MPRVIEKTVYSFNELSDSAKQTARDNYTSSGYPWDEWWDSVYDDAQQIAPMLGITIEVKERTGRLGRVYTEPQINFSGFSSQGDGACYRGSYAYEPDAIPKIKAYCNDGELLRIAEELTLLGITCRLKGEEPLSCTITTSGHYSHSNTMNFDFVGFNDTNSDAEEAKLTRLLRDFADWIYKQLEKEYEYLMSPECVDERLADDDFDEFGNLQS